MGRIVNLDYLRGITALGILFFHYFTWAFGDFNSDSIFGRVGIYGVSIFYVLSGLTLYKVYFNSFNLSKNKLASFYIKRIFRIFPLLWMVTFTSIILSKIIPNILDLALNLSGLFGFIRWDKYFSTGIWSIGNELVFYAFFPILIFTLKKGNRWAVPTLILVLLLYIYFAFHVLQPNVDIEKQWRNYVNPLNQLFLFVGGIYIGHYFSNRLNDIQSWIWGALILVTLIAFCVLPASGNPIAIVTGMNRLWFTLIAFTLCLSFLKIDFSFPKMIDFPLKLAGEISYSVYLLHPIVWRGMNVLLKKVSIPFFENSKTNLLLFCLITTLLLSYFSYQILEKAFIRLGQKVSQRFK